MDISLLKEIGISPIAIVIGSCIIWLINKIPSLLNYQKTRKQEKIESLDKAIAFEPSALEKNLLNELKHRHLFYDATGFDAHENIRQSVIEIIHSSQGQYNFQILTPIKSFLKFDTQHNKMVININHFLWLGLTMMWMIYFIMTLIFLLLIIALLFTLPVIIKLPPQILLQAFLIFAAPIIIVILYSSEARKYSILNQLYKTHHNLFLHQKPKIFWLYTYAFAILFNLYLIVYQGQQLASEIMK